MGERERTWGSSNREPRRRRRREREATPQQRAKMAPKGANKQKKKTKTFVLDCARPAGDKIMEIGSFEKFLKDRVKVNGKSGVLGDSVPSPRTSPASWSPRRSRCPSA